MDPPLAVKKPPVTLFADEVPRRTRSAHEHGSTSTPVSLYGKAGYGDLHPCFLPKAENPLPPCEKHLVQRLAHVHPCLLLLHWSILLSNNHFPAQIKFPFLSISLLT